MTTAKKPRPVQVGVIGCLYHGPQPVQARVKKSLVTNKLFIDCPACGLIMPTLPPFQEHIKSNATFSEDFKGMYGDGRTYDGGGREADGGGLEAPKPKAEPTEPTNKTEETPAPAATPEQTPEPRRVRGLFERPITRSYEEEMGF